MGQKGINLLIFIALTDRANVITNCWVGPNCGIKHYAFREFIIYLFGMSPKDHVNQFFYVHSSFVCLSIAHIK